MAHPDLNQLREVIKKGNKRAKSSKVKKIILTLILIMALIGGYHFVTKENLLTEAKGWIKFATTYVSETYSRLAGPKEIVISAPKIFNTEPLSTEYLIVNVEKEGNIRGEPHLEAPVLTSVTNETKLEYQREHQDDGERYWLKILTEDGTEGWISDNIVLWDKESLAVMRAEATDGNVIAMKDLGKRYEYGIAMDENMNEAFNWYKQAADAGEHESEYIVGWFYQMGEGGVEQDYKKAAEYYERSAVQGYAEAMNNIGYLYAKGYGVRENGDYARQWYEKSIEYGYKDATTNLAVLYLQGAKKLERNLDLGIKFMLEAEEMGDPDAQTVMEVYRSVSEEEFLERIEGS